MTATLAFSKLFTYDMEDSSERLPLGRLADEDGHVHGLLELAISGRGLPHMGFFGPDDVCFNTWVDELVRIVQALDRSETGEYTFDEGEQGQPAFAFRRRGDALAVSVVDSLISGGRADPGFQDVACRWLEFRSAVMTFLADFHATLLEACPLVAERWWAARMAA